MKQLEANGYKVTHDSENPQGEIAVINTCGFIGDAKEESINMILEFCQAKEEGRLKKLYVMGCLSERYLKELQVEIPQVDKFYGKFNWNELLADLGKTYQSDYAIERHLTTPKHYAYLKISEGCNHRCTFCIIPSMRGDLVSRPVGSVLEEAAALKRAGVKEVLVISQDTSAYGVDTKYKLDFWNGQPVKTKFYDMCEALGQLGIWVRLHYVYPYPHVDAVIDLMAQGKILPYLDIPFQHASPRILKLMKRPAHSENTLERLKIWREKCPELVIRSTFVVGFPGETEEDFQMLLDWLQEAQLDRVGCFTYSPVEGATANDLPDHVPEEIKQERYERFMQIQQAISAAKLQQRIGQTMTVLVDGLEDEYPVAVARSYADAPEIDGNVFVEDIDKSQIKAGDLLEVEITDADEYDLFAKLIKIKAN